MKLRSAAMVLALAATSLNGQAMPSAPTAAFGGEVLEVRDVEGYTYLRLKTGQGEMWAAVPTASVKKGARVSLVNAALMQNFESKTLKKTFDKIVFAQLAGTAALLGAPQAATRPAAVSEVLPKVAKATGTGARTIAEVFTGKTALKDKPVVVRGQVVKVNTGIMGKNWIHLRDGSGAAVDGTHDILVTTRDATAVGDVVTAKGTVRTDVTVGPGYAYAVLIEDALLRK